MRLRCQENPARRRRSTTGGFVEGAEKDSAGQMMATLQAEFSERPGEHGQRIEAALARRSRLQLDRRTRNARKPGRRNRTHQHEATEEHQPPDRSPRPAQHLSDGRRTRHARRQGTRRKNDPCATSRNSRFFGVPTHGTAKPKATRSRPRTQALPFKTALYDNIRRKESEQAPPSHTRFGVSHAHLN